MSWIGSEICFDSMVLLKTSFAFIVKEFSLSENLNRIVLQLDSHFGFQETCKFYFSFSFSNNPLRGVI